MPAGGTGASKIRHQGGGLESQSRLPKDICVPARRNNEIVHGKRAISADTALRLSRYFGMSDRFWINLQSRYDSEMEKDLLTDRLDREVRPRAAAG
ncbi:MAG: HigA family addiction module antitoxin [Candidatus Deferrimicrobiaceae bacterium]